MIKKISFLLLIFFISNNSVLAEDKIAFIDLNYIYKNSSAGKKINDEIKNRSKKLNSDFKKFQEKIDSEKEKIIAQKNVLSKEEYEKKLQSLQKNLNEYNSTISKKQIELQKYKIKARSEFSKELVTILQEYSKTNSIAVVLQKENILIGKNDLDVTESVFEIFNKKVKKISAK